MIVQDNVSDASDWCFIIGFGRTGTSALVKTLNSHPAMCMLAEVWMWGYADLLQTPKYDTVLENSPMYRSIEYYKADLPSNLGVHLNNYAFKDASRPDVEENIWNASEIRELMEAFRRMTSGANTSMFGEKKWYYRFILDDLLKVLPNCHLLITTRNKWDLAASSVDTPSFQQRHPQLSRKQLAELALERAEKICQEDRDFLKKYDNMHEVSFEDMAKDSEAVVSELLNIIDLNPSGYNWSILDELWHHKAINHWERVPELVEIRNA